MTDAPSGSGPGAERDFVVKAVREAAEREVEQRVYQRIKSDLFKLKMFGAAGGIIVLVAVYFHQPILNFIVDRGSGELKELVGRQIRDEKEILANNRATQKIIEEQIRNYITELGRHQTQLAELSNRFETRKVALETAIHKVNDSLRRANETKEVIDERVATAQSTAQEASQRISHAAEQIGQISKTVTVLLADLKSRKLIQQQIETPTAATQPLMAAPRPTVYFQFAGFRREEAQQISAQIKKLDWTIPGEERTPLAAKKSHTNQIRFNPANRKSAELLQSDANEVLQKLNVNVVLSLQENQLVKQGILEIWVLKP